MNELRYEDLLEYPKLKHDLECLQLEIQDKYSNVKSPSFEEHGGKSSVRTASDPTATTVSKIQDLKEEESEIRVRMTTIENAIDRIEEPEVRLICYEHFVLGWTWEAVCLRVRKHNGSWAIRKVVESYFKRET